MGLSISGILNPLLDSTKIISLAAEQKKGTFKIQKSQIAILVLNQPPISAVCWGPKHRTNRGFPVYGIIV